MTFTDYLIKSHWPKIFFKQGKIKLKKEKEES
jgi:hypothetical protein